MRLSFLIVTAKKNIRIGERKPKMLQEQKWLSLFFGSRCIIEESRRLNKRTLTSTDLLEKFFGDVRTGLIGKRYHQRQQRRPRLSPHVAFRKRKCTKKYSSI